MLSSFPRPRTTASPALPALLLALVLVLMTLPAAELRSRLSGTTAPMTAALPAQVFGRLPLSFIPNLGQADASVRYQTRGMG